MSDEKQSLENGLELSITADGKEETTEEQADQAQEEEILSEEELEIQRKIESYQSKIGELDTKLSEFKSEHIKALKRKQMKERYYSEEQIERYLSYIEGETTEEIEQSISDLSQKIQPANDNFVDPSLNNGPAAKPRSVDFKEIGRQAYQRIKHKIF